ncbi:Actin/actin-like protein [Rhypophila sp. PSN 637]
MVSGNEKVAIVIDNSSSKLTNAGFAGEDGPRAVFPTVVGRPRFQGVICFGSNMKDVYVGDEVHEKNKNYNSLMTSNPMDDGLVTNWLDMEKIWHHAFYDELKVEPEEHDLLITDRFLPPSVGDNREMMTQIVFETFMVPRFLHDYAESLSMYMYYTTESSPDVIRVHSNDTLTTITPFMAHTPLRQAAMRINFGGRDVTASLLSNLSPLGDKTSALTPETARDIKEDLCYVVLNSDRESDPNTPWVEQPYKLPDGRMISVGEEQYKVTEDVFTTRSTDIPSIQQAIAQVISKCDKSIRAGLRSEIRLSGGNTRFPGYKERLAKELDKILPPPEGWDPDECKIRVTNRADEKNAAWVGGSIVASLSTFRQNCITRELYDEYGPVTSRWMWP